MLGSFFYIDMNICNWNLDERPREKMREKGTASLSNAELLAIIINSGTRTMNAVELSRKILSDCGNSLRNLSKMSLEELRSTPGIGEAKAARLIATFELAARSEAEVPEAQPVIQSSECVAKIFRPMLRNLRHEECWILYLDRANKLIAKERLSTGGISATVMDTKIIIKKAVDKLASGIIVVHNHPSGNPYPGEVDKKQTRLLKDAAKLLDISLLDHIIIGGNRYYSFSDEAVN